MEKIAQRYVNNTTVLSYELLYEPIANNIPSLNMYNQFLEPLYKNITKAIREIDNNHIIILGGA